jgi:excinuclease ABC subunit C
MNERPFDAKSLVASLPLRPGVYRMYDAEDHLIYVGKAARLRDRVGSYFSSRTQSPKVAAMLRRVARLDVTVVNSETEALLLECNLIKAHRPRYNIILRDDKSFPFLICPSGHEYPRLQLWRGTRRPPGREFGPFPNAGAVKEVLQHLQKVFRIRNCRDSFFAHRSRPCLQYQIGRCSAPCVGLITPEAYGRDLQHAIQVLDGEGEEVSATLQRRMDQASAELRFEEAAQLRDQLGELQAVRTRQIATGPRTRDVDAIALVGEPGGYAVSVLTVRDGQSLGTAHQFPISLGEPAETLAAFILLQYSRTAPPAEVLINLALPDQEALAEALAAVAGRAVHLHQPTRGLPRSWVAQAEENAHQAWRSHLANHDATAAALAGIGEVLALGQTPARIECFDISHLAGEGTVASCVVFGPDGAEKRSYRRYNIEDVAPGDDYAAIRQALERHGARIVSGDRPRPDLILIDGGTGQLTAALEGLQAARCTGLNVASVSKGPDRRVGQERIHLPGQAHAVSLAPDSPVLHLIQRIRDEAHRFAITGHRRRRARRFRESVLEAVPGLGPARRRALLTHFGGLAGVLRAAVADLQQVPGVGAGMAQSIYDHLHPGAP